MKVKLRFSPKRCYESSFSNLGFSDWNNKIITNNKLTTIQKKEAFDRNKIKNLRKYVTSLFCEISSIRTEFFLDFLIMNEYMLRK